MNETYTLKQVIAKNLALVKHLKLEKERLQNHRKADLDEINKLKQVILKNQGIVDNVIVKLKESLTGDDTDISTLRNDSEILHDILRKDALSFKRVDFQELCRVFQTYEGENTSQLQKSILGKRRACEAGMKIWKRVRPAVETLAKLRRSDLA